MKKALVLILIAILTITLFTATTLARPDRGPGWKKKIEPAPEPVPEPAPTTGTLLLSDYFDRPDGLFADEFGRLDPLGIWKVTSGAFYAYGQQGYSNSSVFRAVTNKSDFTDFDMRVKMLRKNYALQPYEGLQLFFRYKDPYNLYVVGLRNDNYLHLKKKVNDNYYTLANVPLPTKNDYWYNVRVLAKGTYIEIYVDGVRYINKYDSSFASGKVGVRTDNIGAYFDNFEVFTY